MATSPSVTAATTALLLRSEETSEFRDRRSEIARSAAPPSHGALLKLSTSSLHVLFCRHHIQDPHAAVRVQEIGKDRLGQTSRLFRGEDLLAPNLPRGVLSFNRLSAAELSGSCVINTVFYPSKIIIVLKPMQGGRFPEVPVTATLPLRSRRELPTVILSPSSILALAITRFDST